MRSIGLKAIMVISTIFFLSSFVQDNPSEISAVINGENGEKEMTMDKLKNVVMGKTTRWSDGKAVKLAFMSPATETTNTVASKVFGSGYDGAKMSKYFVKLVFQGKISAPQYFTSEPDLVKYVMSTPGAVGFVKSGKVGSAKVLSVDGKTGF